MAPAHAVLKTMASQPRMGCASTGGLALETQCHSGVPPTSMFIPVSLSTWRQRNRHNYGIAVANLTSSTFVGTHLGDVWTDKKGERGIGRVSEQIRRVHTSPRCAKAKAKAKTKSSAGRPKPKPWPFEDLMMFWDVAFEKWCEEPERTKLIVETAREGLAAYGRGAVLVRETVAARSTSGAGAGFGPAAQRQRLPEGEQQFDSLGYEVEYMPRWKMERPTDPNTDTEVPAGAPPVVSYENLRPLLGSLDCTRMLTLTKAAAAGPATTAITEEGNELPVEVLGATEEEISASEGLGFEFAEEKPYNSDEGELVLLMAVTVDGQLAVGADVVQQVPREPGEGSGSRLVTRDELFL